MTRFSCFITGTDTGIGKTFTACALLVRLDQEGLRTAGMKPVAAGAVLQGGVWHNEDTDALMQTAGVKLPQELVTPYLFQQPASPHIAAKANHNAITWPRIRDAYDAICARADTVVVEGVGGFMAPLTEESTVADLAVQFGLPVILVVGMRLGCLNHALLTAEAIRARNLVLAGWAANCIDPAMPHQNDNIALLKKRIPAPLLGIIPYIPSQSAKEAANYLNLPLLP